MIGTTRFAIIRMMLPSLLFAITLFSCTSKTHTEENSEEQQIETKEKAYQDAWAKTGEKFDENETELKRNEEEEKKANFINALQGTWEYKGRIHVYGSQYEAVSCRLVVDGNKITFYGNDGINDQGMITDIDFDEGVISFGEHSTVEFDIFGEEDLLERPFYLWFERKSRGMGRPFAHVSKTPSYKSSCRSSNSASNNSSTIFNTSSDVMAYVSNRFRNSSGNTITIKYDGLYSNGNQITNAVRVVRFNGSRASLSATSPYTQGTLYFTVDASRGTITDGSGDVFYIQ